jgi:hypothetical protein
LLFRRRCHAVYRKREDGAPAAGAAPPLAWLPCDFCDAWAHPACEATHAPVRLLPLLLFPALFRV